MYICGFETCKNFFAQYPHWASSPCRKILASLISTNFEISRFLRSGMYFDGHLFSLRARKMPKQGKKWSWLVSKIYKKNLRICLILSMNFVILFTVPRTCVFLVWTATYCLRVARYGILIPVENMPDSNVCPSRRKFAVKKGER